MTSATVIILTYNRLDMLQRAVASARWQTHGRLEIMVVDNGSDAPTREWLAGLDDPRLRVLTFEDNVHPTHARNTALKAATGDWVGFLDDDDLWAPDKADAMVRAGEAAGAAWAYCGCVYIDPHSRVIGGRAPRPLDRIVQQLPVAYSIPGGFSGVMWRKDALPDGGLLDDRMTYCEDWDMALRLLAVSKPAAVARPLMGYRQHVGAWSRGVGAQQHEFDLIGQKHKPLRGRRQIRMGEHHRYVAAQASRAGVRREAAHHYLRGIRHRDLQSVPRLIGAMLPDPLPQLLRTFVLSERSWMRAGATWIDALHQQAIPPAT